MARLLPASPLPASPLRAALTVAETACPPAAPLLPSLCTESWMLSWPCPSWSQPSDTCASVQQCPWVGEISCEDLARRLKFLWHRNLQVKHCSQRGTALQNHVRTRMSKFPERPAAPQRGFPKDNGTQSGQKIVGNDPVENLVKSDPCLHARCAWLSAHAQGHGTFTHCCMRVRWWNGLYTSKSSFTTKYLACSFWIIISAYAASMVFSSITSPTSLEYKGSSFFTRY